jgi:hypothetical protein
MVGGPGTFSARARTLVNPENGFRTCYGRHEHGAVMLYTKQTVSMRSLSAIGRAGLCLAFSLCCFGTPEDLRAIIQEVIDVPDLQEYFHYPEDPRRAPLVIEASRLIDSTMRLTKFVMPVLVLRRTSIRAQGLESFMRLRHIKLGDKSGIVVMEYPVEGVVVTCRLERRLVGWTIVDTEVVEE